MVTTKRAALAALVILASACYRTGLDEDADEMEKRHLTVPLAGGLATGQDGKQIPIGKSEELVNVRPGRLGEVVQRSGSRVLGQAIIGGGGATLPSPWALATLRRDLVAFSGVGSTPAAIYSPTADQWSGAVRTQLHGPIVTSATRVSGEGSTPDVAYSGGYFFVAYKTSDAAGFAVFHELVIDATTGAELMEHVFTVGAGGPFNIMVRVVNGYAVFIREAPATAIAFDAWQVSNLTAGPTTTTFAGAAIFYAFGWDAIANGLGLSVVYATTGAGTATGVDFFPATATATAFALRDNTAAAFPINRGANWMLDYGVSGRMAIVSASGTQGVRVQWNIPTSGATRQAGNTYVIAGASFNASPVSGWTTASSASGTFQTMHTNSTGGSSTTTVISTWTAGVASTSTTRLQVSLRSKTFLSAGEYYAIVETQYLTQGTRYVMRIASDSTTTLVARAQVNGNGSQVSLADKLSNIANVNGAWTAATTVQIRLQGNPTGYQPNTSGIELLSTRFLIVGDTTVGTPREAIDSLFVPGGTVGQFDGVTFSTAGFNQYPEAPAVVPSAVGGGMTAASTYYYREVFMHSDAAGRVWRSAPSQLSQVALGANTSADVFATTLTTADRSDVVIEIYRGAANDNNTMQLVGTVINDPTVSTITFHDGASDLTQASGEALYTNGAAGNRPLAADGIPGATSLCIAGNRAWFISNDNPYEVWVSNKFIPGQGWRFSEQNKLILNDAQGPVVGLAAQPNGVVVAIKEAAYYLISGDGPNQAGNGGSFTVSAPAVGIGTNNPRSILETPSGIEFQSTGKTRAWYRVNTALQAEYLGSPIERYTNDPSTGLPLSIVGAVLIPSTGETRYYTGTSSNTGAKRLVHDSISDTWMIDVAQQGSSAQVAACAYLAGAAVAIATGAIFVDDPTTGSDAGTPFTVTTTNPWIKGSDLDGYAMFVRVRGVGEAPASPPPISITMQADFDATTNVTVQSAAPGVLWDWELKYPAKLSSFRFTISYVASAVPVRMSALVVEYGVKSGLAPLAYLKRSQ